MKYVIMFLAANAPLLLIDIFSCILELRRNNRGSGPSGIPFPVTLLGYAYITLLFMPVFWVIRLAMLISAMLLQTLLLFVIPGMHRRFIKFTKS